MRIYIIQTSCAKNVDLVLQGICFSHTLATVL